MNCTSLIGWSRSETYSSRVERCREHEDAKIIKLEITDA